MSLKVCPKCAGPYKEGETQCPWCRFPLPDSTKSKTIENYKSLVSPSIELAEFLKVDFKCMPYLFAAANHIYKETFLCPRCKKNSLAIKSRENEYFVTCLICKEKIHQTEVNLEHKPLFSLVPFLSIMNNNDHSIEGITIVVNVGGGYTEEWKNTVDIPSGKPLVIENEINPKICRDKLPRVADPTYIYIELYQDEKRILARSKSLLALPYNQMIFTDELGTKYDELLACFVTPNDLKVESAVNSAKIHLKKATDTMDFPGYQRPEIVTAQINALYDTLKFDYNLSYLSAPPKYELGATQNILFPHMVIEQEQGCCIDLAILFASCIERVGLDPVIFITTGHAFPGFFQGSLIERLETKESIWENGITESFDDVYKLVKDGHLVPFEASSIYNISFQEAKDDILNYGKLERENFKTALDISYLHKIGVTPLLT